MKNPSSSRFSSRFLFIRALGAAFFLILMVLGGCEPVDMGNATVKPVDTATGEASLQLINQRQIDPGQLEFLLYSSTAQDIQNIAEVRKLGTVAFEQSLIVKVPAGKWKFGYKAASGELHAMPPTLSEAERADWPVATLAKEKSYLIMIETDEANHTVWRHNIPVQIAP